MTGCFLKKHLSFSLKSEFKSFVLGSCSSWWEISKRVILQKWTDAITTRTFTFLSSEANQVSVLRKQCCLQDGSQTPTQGVNDDYWRGCGGPALTSDIPAGSCINKVNYVRKVVCSYVGGMLGGGHMSPDEFYAKQNVNTRAASVTAGGAPSYKSPWF